ncbi:MAG TPA: ABC transporter permease [Candidatus Limnocylindrales bacterium]|jgi:general nucleoside transport system permease protein|nr:ABC transporter permease [Candidatus Limnocylindrales bacterium]
MSAETATAGGRTMTASERTLQRRQRILGTVYLLAATVIVIYFALPIDGATQSRLVLNLPPVTFAIPDLVLPSAGTLYFMALVAAFAGAIQLTRGFGARWALVLGLVATAFVFAFLVWVAAGQSMSLTGLLQTSVQRAVPIVFGALSGILCERAGVINIAIEGMLLSGAFVGAVVASITGDVGIGVLGAVLVGGLLGALLAVLAIRYMVDQIVAGFVINILVIGLTGFLATRVLQQNQQLNTPPRLTIAPIPLLSDIPILGPILFRQNIFVYALFILVIVIFVGLFYTRWGLRVRAVGEHPKAADTAGINVYFVRYRNVIMGGLVAGLGGAYFTIGSGVGFEREMTAGRGFIGLAAMIFGGWNPLGAAGAGLIFGFADAIQARTSILGIPIPSELLGSLPYIVTIIVVAGLVGRARAPAADGQPYKKE